jgi:hypothetical protein
MKNARATRMVLLAWLALAGRASAEATATSGSPPTEPAPSSDEAEPEASWSLSASAYVYFVPDSSDYVLPIFSADHDWLHLEARYNYEDLQTGSTWVGYNLSGGDELGWELTPILGAVFGNTNGVAPGYEGTLRFWMVELYSEGEYVFDFGSASDHFFYNWSELALVPVEWLRFGLVAQRTRVYQTERDIQRGILAGFSYKVLSFTAYLFNPDDSKPIGVAAVSLDFEP